MSDGQSAQGQQTAAHFIEAIRSPQLRESFDRMKSDLGTMTPEQSEALDRYFEHKTRSLVECYEDLVVDGDDAEFARFLPHIWIEFRLEWNRVNTQMQYQTMMKGEASPHLMARGGILSEIVGIIERHLANRDVYWVTKFAADPLAVLGSRAEISQRILEMANGAGSAGREILEGFFQLREELDARVKDPATKAFVEERVDKIVAEAEGILVRSISLTMNDMAEGLEMATVRLMHEAPLTMVVGRGACDDDASVPSEAAALLIKIYDSWIQKLIARSLEHSPGERMAAGKTSHLALQWSIRRTENARFVLEIEDDGKGSMTGETVMLPASTWHFEIEDQPGQGSKLRVSYPGSSVHQMFLATVNRASQPVLFALPADSVVRIAALKTISDLPGGRRVGITQEGQSLPVIPLETVLWGDQRNEKPVYVQIRTARGEEFLVTVNQAVGTTRSSIRPPPAAVGHGVFEGYVLLNGRIAPVLDVSKLKATFDSASPSELVRAS